MRKIGNRILFADIPSNIQNFKATFFYIFQRNKNAGFLHFCFGIAQQFKTISKREILSFQKISGELYNVFKLPSVT